MRFEYLYDRATEDWAFRFDDVPDSVKVRGRTIGCGCCSSEKDVSKEDLEKEIKALEERLDALRLMLARNFQ